MAAAAAPPAAAATPPVATLAGATHHQHPSFQQTMLRVVDPKVACAFFQDVMGM